MIKYNAQIFLLFALIFVPNAELTRQIRLPFPGTLPELLHPGAPLIVKKNGNTSRYRISTKAMSLFKDEYYFGAIDLYYEKQTMITGLFDLPQRSFISKFFKQKETYYFAEPISILRPKVKAPVTLRFPASVQKNVIEADQQLKDKERALLRSSLMADEESIKDLCWRNPLDSAPVGQFGKPRFLPNKEIYFHSGLDLRASVGTKVHATADGIVRFAQKLIVPGNIVALYHGDGLISLYMHLSKINVTPGQMVKRGDVIALTGETGRVEGPHLHWEVRWKGISLDPLALLRCLRLFSVHTALTSEYQKISNCK
ncbi:MAG: hypothetical protein A4S09_00155 [Proteobacteria bacterium SG_bin7]|nr:MAG: hypothetical protein A4S09_00155 [Proteobacteria bacterium SG_bin7]